MIEVKFPDSSTRSYAKGTTVLDVAKDISEGLARNVLSAKFNNRTVETASALQEDGDLQQTYNEMLTTTYNGGTDGTKARGTTVSTSRFNL